jgi:hypothetical protein
MPRHSEVESENDSSENQHIGEKDLRKKEDISKFLK